MKSDALMLIGLAYFQSFFSRKSMPPVFAVVGILFACTITSAHGQSTNCTPPAGIIAWWAGAGNADDQVGTNNGVIHGGVTFTPGMVGDAFNFNGTSGFIDIASNSNLNPTASFSIEGWIYPRQIRVQTVIHKWVSNAIQPNQRSYCIYTTASGALFFGISDAAHQGDASFHAFGTTNNVLASNTWFHIAAVYDQPSGTRRIYINGVQVAERTDAPITVLASTGNVGIGAGAGASPADTYFDGMIDELSFYSRALAPGEIQNIYNASGGGKCGLPTIMNQPHAQIGYWGKGATFTVTAGGEPPLSYQWYRNSQPVPGGTDFTLTLTNLQASDAGTYFVVVTNSLGGIASTTALLTVNPSGVAISLHTSVTIDGVVGLTYGIQYTTDLNSTNAWHGIANVTLSSPTQLWFDLQPAVAPPRYYRVVPGPISIP